MDIWQQEQGHSTNDIMPYLRRLVHAWTEIKTHSGRNHQLSVFGEILADLATVYAELPYMLLNLNCDGITTYCLIPLVYYITIPGTLSAELFNIP
jgi:hypothetical protein